MEAILLDQRTDQVNAFLIRARLRAQVGHVVSQIAGTAAAGVLGRPHEQVFTHGLLIEGTALNELDGLNGGTLLPQLGGVGGERAGRDAANVGMMATGGDIEDDLVVVEEGRDNRDVGQVRAAADCGISRWIGRTRDGSWRTYWGGSRQERRPA